MLNPIGTAAWFPHICICEHFALCVFGVCFAFCCSVDATVWLPAHFCCVNMTLTLMSARDFS